MPSSIKKVIKDYKNKLTSREDIISEDDPKLLYNKKTKVPGLDTDDSANAAGRADFLTKQVRDNLGKLGFDLDGLKKQKTIAQLLPAPFGFRFSLMWPKENEWGEKGYVSNIDGKEIEETIETKAKVKNPNADGGLILTVKDGYDVYFFDEKELNRTLGSGDGSAKLPPGKKGENYKRLLEEGITYKVKIDKSITVGGGTDDQDGGDIPIPEEIASGKNRNEIFRLLLNKFGGFDGSVVYGDGFKSIEQAREYSKLQKAVKSGKVDKSKLKEFREKANRSDYSMMVSNLRKSFPNTFLSKLSKAFPEFKIGFSKEGLGEGLSKTTLLEEENVDMGKRWGMVFPSGVVGQETIEGLDKNVIKFMSAVKKWFAVPVKGFGGKSRSYTVNYDKDSVNAYWNKFYGNKNESKIYLSNVLLEMIKEEGENEDGKKEVKPDYVLLKILSGGLSTIDEDNASVEERKSGKTKKGGFIDAIIVKAASELNKKNNKLFGGPFEIKPGFSNLDKTASEKKAKIELNLTYDGDKITDGTLDIKDNPSGLNELLNKVISSGNMRVKVSDTDKDYIILYYPSKTAIASRINNTWKEILK